MARYKLTLEYDGRFFSGWQKQTERQKQREPITVQGTVEEALKKLTGEAVALYGAGRTDRGVHATGQVAHMTIKKPLSLDSVWRGTNFYLKRRHVTVLRVESVDEAFHARFSALARTYRYLILNRKGPSVLDEGRVWWLCKPLDVRAMQAGATYFLGHHDFSSFRDKNCQSASPFKTLDRLEVSCKGDRIEILIKSRSFLHSQVRIMVGTLVWVGEGRLVPEDVEKVLLQKDRRRAGPTAPPQGLYLETVDYHPH